MKVRKISVYGRTVQLPKGITVDKILGYFIVLKSTENPTSRNPILVGKENANNLLYNTDGTYINATVTILYQQYDAIKQLQNGGGSKEDASYEILYGSPTVNYCKADRQNRNCSFSANCSYTIIAYIQGEYSGATQTSLFKIPTCAPSTEIKLLDLSKYMVGYGTDTQCYLNIDNSGTISMISIWNQYDQNSVDFSKIGELKLEWNYQYDAIKPITPVDVEYTNYHTELVEVISATKISIFRQCKLVFKCVGGPYNKISLNDAPLIKILLNEPVTSTGTIQFAQWTDRSGGSMGGANDVRLTLNKKSSTVIIDTGGTAGVRWQEYPRKNLEVEYNYQQYDASSPKLKIANFTWTWTDLRTHGKTIKYTEYNHIVSIIAYTKENRDNDCKFKHLFGSLIFNQTTNEWEIHVRPGDSGFYPDEGQICYIDILYYNDQYDANANYSRFFNYSASKAWTEDVPFSRTENDYAGEWVSTIIYNPLYNRCKLTFCANSYLLLEHAGNKILAAVSNSIYFPLENSVLGTIKAHYTNENYDNNEYILTLSIDTSGIIKMNIPKNSLQVNKDEVYAKYFYWDVPGDPAYG